MEGTNRTAGAEGLFTTAGDDNHRAVVALDDARRGDADNTAVPAFSIDHNAVGFAERGIIRDALLDREQDATLFFLTLGIEAIQFPGQQPRTISIFHAEQFDHVAGNIHASSGVDARGYPEGNFGGVGRTLGGNLRDLEQRLEAGIYGAAQSIEAEAGEDAIFAG